MQKITRWVGVSLLFFVAACVPITFTQTTLSATITETAKPGLTYEDILNAAIVLPFTQETVTLTNGEAAGNAVTGAFSVKVLPEYGVGDLNSDGQDDLAVLIAESGGGSGVFVSMLVFISRDGQAVQSGVVTIDDRPVIRSLSINEGAIQLEALVHNLNDNMAEPKLSINSTYRYLGGIPVLMEKFSAYDNGIERTILIDSPVEKETVSNVLQVIGSMPVAPFENNLSLTIWDLANFIIDQSGFMVSADEPGGPATFNNQIDLSMVPSGTIVRLELADISMADGSILVSKSVIVKIK